MQVADCARIWSQSPAKARLLGTLLPLHGLHAQADLLEWPWVQITCLPSLHDKEALLASMAEAILLKFQGAGESSSGITGLSSTHDIACLILHSASSIHGPEPSLLICKHYAPSHSILVSLCA